MTTTTTTIKTTTPTPPAFKTSAALWDQRKTLLPPPYEGPLRRLAKGIHVGDPTYDSFPQTMVCGHGGQAKGAPLEPAPSWVDWDSVRRGQELFRNNLGRNTLALTIALLQGFSITRFAMVLHANGYAQSPETAYHRYRETAFAIFDWMIHPLDDPESRALTQIKNVRAMHSFARRRSVQAHLFPNPDEEGVPLSQYDMAEVLLGFAGLAPSIMEHEMGVAKPSRRDREALCHTWRLLGFWLGIHDEFNPCRSLDEMEEMVDEYMTWVPLRLQTCRPETFALQSTAVEGFGMYTGLGVESYVGMLHATCNARGLEIDYLARKSVFGMKTFGTHLMKFIATAPVNYVMSNLVLWQRQLWEKDPATQKKLMPVLRAASRPLDWFVWRFAGFQAWLLQSRVLAFVVGFLVMRRVVRGMRRVLS